jgi:hypothetical protein
MTAPRTIACMKWGAKYGPAYANILRAMLERWLEPPFRLVCFTDDPHGLDPRIETRPLPDVPVGPDWPERGWNKLGLFHPGLDLPAEPTLYLDLDVVITGEMSVFFEVPGRFLISNDWNWRKPGIGNSSVFRWIPGSQDHIWEGFSAAPDQVRQAHRNEQEYVSTVARGLDFWPEPLCRSFKRHCLPRGMLKPFLTPRLPPGARVLIFHGDPKPGDAIAGRSAKWYRRFRPAPWLADYYRQ